MKNKKIILFSGIFVILLFLLIFTNKPIDKKEVNNDTNEIGTTIPTPTTSISEPSTLSELQIAACNSADNGGSCNTKLPQLGLVTAEDCCKYLGKCC